jgi:hypothetical protein
MFFQRIDFLSQAKVRILEQLAQRSFSQGCGTRCGAAMTSWHGRPRAHKRFGGRRPPSGNEDQEDEDGEQHEVNEARQDVGAPAAEGHQADQEGQHQQDRIVLVDAELERLF